MPPADCAVIFVSDLEGRRSVSREVPRHQRDRPIEFDRQVILRGNHEEVVLRALGGEPRTIPDRLRYGGDVFLCSYGLDPGTLDQRNVKSMEAAIRNRAPAEDLAFLHPCVDSVRFGDYVFVHAGIRPGVSLAAQSGADLR